ncbi:hypothetical protein [Clostridium septicum]|uniref:Uncharacterized protein n=1 Tax=Clostridium septicum TaxID=1504 RepID=A0A9N7JMF5_CLOSE|nr:hypothetical protein [Clostridium septicum]AYE35288.1 hypothetical protein CP523_13115 [Clostridium septicum]MDU1313916.1 hypothetical protein [Clostridium septicum]QAS60682.1 hypothetical protein EI377_07985 [Clostridium septicum]UEC20060.1 hypothetical protein LK444_11675 [Clostridium septicum]USS01884.1 hypothetical protein NH397_05495 [Clostridium septicum]
MNEIIEIKKEYNYYLKRNSNAEIYFKNESIESCLKHLKLFNDIALRLSKLQTIYKDITGLEMTKDERINGFKNF